MTLPERTGRAAGDSTLGYVYLHGIKFQIAKQRAFLAPKGQAYVSNGIRRGRPSKS